MPTLLSNIPGLEKAVADARAEEEQIRYRPYLTTTLDILSVSVRQFTPRHFLYLDCAGSPFLNGGPIDASNIAQFLWVISEDFRAGDTVARDHFFSGILAVEIGDAIEQIKSYIDDAWMDRPGGGGKSSEAPITCYLADFVDVIASEYGWNRDTILDTPFAELFQYLRRIRARNNPRANFINRSDKVRNAFVKKYQAQQAKKTKRKRRKK